jgi:tetratricopeptide (TPR) repeat protein
MVLFAVLTTAASTSQTDGATHRQAPAQRGSAQDSPALAELQKRLAAAQAARNSGDPDAVARASHLLIALALREMAHLRLVEGALPASIDIYKRSLDFEDTPGTRIDLAVAYLQSEKPDDALTEAGKAILADPSDPRGWHVQGAAYLMKKEYTQAADSLRRSISIRNDHEAAYSLAVSLLGAHQKEQAAAVFKLMEKGAAKPGVLHVLEARAYRDAGNLDDAVAELKTALAIDPKTRHAHYLLGLVYLLQEEWAPQPKIRDQFLAELQLNPRDFLSNYLLGAMGSNQKNYTESDHYLKIATEIDGSWPEPWLYLGLNANSQGDAHAAEDDLRKSITLTGKDDARSNYLIRKAYFALGRILVQSDRRQEAEQYLEKARELQERVQAESQQNSPVNRAAMGGGEEYLPKNEITTQASPSEARQTEDSAAQIDASILAQAHLTAPEQAAAVAQEKQLRAILGAGLNDLATTEALRNRYPAALLYCQEAERWDPTAAGLMRNLGIAATHAGNYPEAVRALARVLSEQPNDTAVRGMLGLAYYMTDQYKDAVQTISPLGSAAVKDPGLAYAFADSYAKQGLLNESGEVLAKLDEKTLPIDTLMLVGSLWDDIGNHARALQAFHVVLERDPAHPKAHYNAGVALIKADHPADAAVEFQAELALAPSDPDAKYDLGLVDLQLSKRDDAVTLFREVIAAHPEHARAQYQLGKILLDAGNAKEALPYLEAAARLSPQTDYVHYQLQAAYRDQARLQDADRELAIYKELKKQKRDTTTPRPDMSQ